MADDVVELVRENAMIALTYMSASSKDAPPESEGDAELIRELYPKERMYKGAFFIASTLLSMEAAERGITVPERIAQVRALMQNEEFGG